MNFEKAFNYTVTHDLLPADDDPASQLGHLAAKIAYNNFPWRFLTLVMFNSIQAIGLDTFLKNYQQTVYLKLGKFVPHHRVTVPQFVIFGEDASEISTTLQWIISSNYDCNANYLIVCAHHEQDCDELKVFQTLRKLLILNAVLLKMSNDTREPSAYSYQIISDGICVNNVPRKIDLTTNCYNDKCLSGLFKEQLKNFHRCRLIMSTVEQPPFMYLHNGTRSPSGIDGDLMKLAADMLNATLILRTPTDGSDSVGHYANQNWTGSLGDIFNGKCQASVCAAPLTTNKYGNFQISFTYYSMDIVWATRLSPETASWEKLLNPFNLDLRIALLFTFIVIILMNMFCKINIRILRNVRRIFKMESPRYSLIFYSWIIFLGMPILRTPRNRSFLITLYTWIWFCFVIRCAYQAGLIYSMKEPAYHKTLESFQDVLNDGLPYGGQVSLKEYYQDDPHIYDNWRVVDLDNMYETLDEILDGTTSIVLAANKEVIKHHLMKYNGTKVLQIIPHKIVNSPMVVYLKKYSPLTAPISYVLRIALEAGFVHRIFNRYLEQDKILLRLTKSKEREPLSMKHFAGSFALLLIGSIISTAYFAVEYICGNLKDE